METKDCERSDMEDTMAHTTKTSDSGYSNSCSNSQSQRSGSSKSRNSGSSSGSSGYSGHPPTAGSSHESSFQRPSPTKREDHKKKKSKTITGDLINDIVAATTNGSTNNMEPIELKSPNNNTMGIESATLTTGSIQNNEIESHQVNSLAHNLLSYESVKKSKGVDVNAVDNIDESRSSSNSKDSKSQSLKLLEDLRIASPKEQFMLVVSMQEGTVLYTTPNMTNVLGYPKDMWMGRSLFDFIHPKDRDALNKYITSCIVGPLVTRHSQNLQNNGSGTSKQSINTFNCRLRQYRGLRSSGFSVIEKKVDYLPCKISFFFHELNKNKLSSCTTALNTNNADNSQSQSQTQNQNQNLGGSDGICDTLLIANASLIHPAYLDADENCCSTTFVTQHSTSMCWTHVDDEVIPYLGYMPHDMVGKSVIDFYHPEDLHYLKEVYKNVLKDKSQPYNGGKAYRFRTQNGTYALVETDWCGFVNPWTKKLEFIIGQHRVVKGPPVPDVTTVVEQECSSLSEEIVKESNEIKDEIVKLLNDTEENTDEAKLKISKCGKEIITYMEKFFDEEKTAQSKSLPLSFFLSFSQDRESVMLGEISPHHEYCDSKSSSETPPSYNQLNYNDNIERFFESKPKTTRSDESNGQNSTERNATSLSNGEEEGKISPTEQINRNRNSCLNNESGGSSDVSFGSAGNAEKSAKKNAASKKDSYRTPHLTEELLCRHNENMEKKMVQKHRERSKTDRELKLKDSRLMKNYEKMMEAQGNHGVKRSASHSWEGEPFKSSKQTHAEPTTPMKFNGEAAPNISTSSTVFPNTPVSVTTNVNLWPPFSVTVTPMHSTSACHSQLNYTTNHLSNPMMPFYYIQPEMPSGVTRTADYSKSSMPSYMHTQSPYGSSQVQYLGSMMYHPIPMPMFGAPPILFSPLTMLPAPLVPTQPMKPSPKRTKPATEQQIIPPAKTIHMPASQATSVKAEPGSALCSITSHSLRQALSDMSRREVKSMSTSTPTLSQNSSASTQKKPLQVLRNNSDILDNTIQNDSSSYYSSFYSYMKTDEKSDESMKSLTENESSSDANGDGKHETVWKRAYGNNDCKTSEEQMERHIRKEPPWSRDVSLTPEIIFKYQVTEHVLAEVLESDLKILAEINQPIMVNEQLCQLYLDLDSFCQNDCSLETSIGFTSSSGSSAEGEEKSSAAKLKKKKKRVINYDKMGMMFEENAPMPPPLQNAQLTPMTSSCTTAA